MKKTFIYIAGFILVFEVSCTKRFDAINTDPNQTTANLFNPNYLLSQGEWEFSNTGYNQLLFESMWSQALASTYGYYGNGDKYINSGSFVAYRDNLWNADYRAASLIYEMQNLTREKPEFSNLYNIGELLKVAILQRLTDVYGDIPYSQALQAKQGVVQPVYDTQESIYDAMLSQVEAATSALSPGGDKPGSDVIYNGDINKWKRFGYSLMLKLAMRLTKVNASKAQQWAEKAAAGGTFESIDDNAKVAGQQSTGFSNANTNALRVADDYREVRWSETFIDYLQANDDPRISLVAEVSKQGFANNSNQLLAGNNDPAIQIGLPNGYDLNGSTTDIRQYPLYPGESPADPSIPDDVAAPIGNYSRPRTSVYLDYSGINMILTYAQTEFLLAEAKARGWNVGGTSAAQHYANALTAAMKSLAQFNAAATVSDATVLAYVAANPLDVSSSAASIQQINEQYWVETATMFMFIENWINWKRSGYPQLTPVNYPEGDKFTNNTIPRRIPYQSSEVINNPNNYAEAVGRLNDGDTFTSRVWWDAP